MKEMNVLDKAEMIKELVKKEIGEFDDDRLRKMIRKIGKGIKARHFLAQMNYGKRLRKQLMVLYLILVL